MPDSYDATICSPLPGVLFILDEPIVQCPSAFGINQQLQNSGGSLPTCLFPCFVVRASTVMYTNPTRLHDPQPAIDLA